MRWRRRARPHDQFGQKGGGGVELGHSGEADTQVAVGLGQSEERAWAGPITKGGNHRLA